MASCCFPGEVLSLCRSVLTLRAAWKLSLQYVTLLLSVSSSATRRMSRFLKTLHDSGQLSSFLFQVLESLKRFPTGSDPLRFAVPGIVMDTVCPLHDDCARQVTSRVPRHADGGLNVFPAIPSFPTFNGNVSVRLFLLSSSWIVFSNTRVSHLHGSVPGPALAMGVYACTIPMFSANTNCDKRSRG